LRIERSVELEAMALYRMVRNDRRRWEEKFEAYPKLRGGLGAEESGSAVD
jgi:hypothetical protein